ncbi:MAG: TetR/AcrR family transcriptional regulator [Mycobacterium kyogaense]|uniref:TetR/AcrR family transcriptional regulator n=1 Tax=Mycobacterium kyogaense TaxID=2212479 RepID=UPI002FF75D66
MVTRRPGGRSERVRARVLEAALDHLLAAGLTGLSVRDVAAAAGVAETTVYRRWPTPTDLAAAALAEFARSENPIPDTGTFEGDLRALLGQIVDMVSRPEVERLLRAAAALDSALQGAVEARAVFWQGRFAGGARIVERAIERGEVPPDTGPAGVIEFLVAPVYLRLLLLDLPLDDALLEASVRNTLAAYAVGRQNP